MGGLSAFILVFFSNLHLCHQQDVVLNAPQVLLPFTVKNAPPVTYVLRANKGCFKWYVYFFVFFGEQLGSQA